MSYGTICGGFPASFNDAMRTHGQAMAQDFADQPELCGCRGGGWWLSNYDTWHQCQAHYKGQKHPEEAMAEAADREAYEEWKARDPKGSAAIEAKWAAEKAEREAHAINPHNSDDESDPFAD